MKLTFGYLFDLQFLSPYKIDLPADASFVPPSPAREQFVISAENETIDAVAGTRSFTLKVFHPGVIWTGTQKGLIAVENG